MELGSVAQILQIGFTGFAFLMTGYSARLIHREQHMKNFRKDFISVLSLFGKLSLAMTILSIVAIIAQVTVDIVISDRTSSAQSCRSSLHELSDSALSTANDLVQVRSDVSAAVRVCDAFLNATSDGN